jgi:hypothetical protein
MYIVAEKGGDKPRHYGPASVQKVAAGFIPARYFAGARARQGLRMPRFWIFRFRRDTGRLGTEMIMSIQPLREVGNCRQLPRER